MYIALYYLDIKIWNLAYTGFVFWSSGESYRRVGLVSLSAIYIQPRVLIQVPITHEYIVVQVLYAS